MMKEGRQIHGKIKNILRKIFSTLRHGKKVVLMLKPKKRYIVPLIYDVRKSKILNIEYRIKKQGNSEWIQSWLKNTKESNILYMLPSDVLKKP